MRRAGTAACVLLLLLSGCIAGGCRVSVVRYVVWTEEGLFEDLSSIDVTTPVERTIHRPRGYAVEDPLLDERYGPGNYAVSNVYWLPPADHESTDLGPYQTDPNLDVDGTLRAEWLSTTSDDTVQDHVTQFIANVTGDDGATVERLARAFMANRTQWEGGAIATGDPATGAVPIHVFVAQVDLRGHVRMQQAWDRLHAEPSEDTSTQEEPRPWQFQVDAAMVELENEEAPTWRWSVMADDHAHFRTDVEDPDGILALLSEIREGLSLGEPDAPVKVTEDATKTC